ncbi:MAG: AMP-binding protein [Alteromonadales bacterium]|nr:AMP-binding protein [Alteromonadales bacterium]
MTNNKQHLSIYHYLRDISTKFPKRAALTLVTQLQPEFKHQQQNYSQFFSSMCQSARLVKSLTQTKRPVVSFLLPNIPQAYAIMFGAESIGVANPLNPLLNEESLKNLLELANADVVFALGPNPISNIWQKAQAAVASMERQPILIPVMINAEGYITYETQLQSHNNKPLPEEWLPKQDDVASYFHTGGTTGTPKLAKNTHRNQLASIELCHKSLLMTEQHKVLNGLPLFHVGGAMVNGLSSLCLGMEIVLPTMAGFRDPEVIKHHWKLIEHYSITMSGGIPTSVASMVEVPAADVDISSLKYLIAGGSPVSKALCRDVKRILGLELYTLFGMTECAGAVTLPNVDSPNKIGCAGFVRDSPEIRILGAKQPGDTGELVIRGDMVFTGYLGEESSPVRDGWLHTGDIAYIDEDGYLFITGRIKDLIIRSGHNIDPATIENCLEQHPAVSMAAAVGKPDSYAGELPVVYVQLYSGHEVDAEELMSFTQSNISERPACPKFIKILDELPATAVGKIYKPRLRAMASVTAVIEQFSIKGLDITPEQIQANQLDNGKMQVNTNALDVDDKLLKGILESLNLELA